MSDMHNIRCQIAASPKTARQAASPETAGAAESKSASSCRSQECSYLSILNTQVGVDPGILPCKSLWTNE